jgi:hypothetical protein
MATAVYQAILAEVAVIIQGLGLTFKTPSGSTIIPLVEVLKEPKVQEYLESQGQPGQSGSQQLPVISISPSVEGQPQEAANFNLNIFVTYPVDVTISAGGNRDFAANLGTWLLWREQIRNQFCGTILTNVPPVYNTNADPDPAIDRESLQDNYDMGTLTIRFDTFESRVQLTPVVVPTVPGLQQFGGAMKVRASSGF